MKITRRYFLPLFFCLLVTSPAVPQTSNQKFLVFVGTYTDKTNSKGIYAFDFDASTGKLTPKGLAAETSNPSWLVIHPNGKWAYAANESGKQSSITAFSSDAKSAKLTQLNKIPALGEDPCYLSFDKTGKYLFVANYTSGNVVVFPILPDGRLGEHTANVKDQGTLGPNKERQDGPHAHWIAPFGETALVYVTDLGLDRVLVYQFDPAKGMLSPVTPGGGWSRSKHGNVPSFAKLSPGSGPRHLAFSPIGARAMYVLSEVESTVTVFPSYPGTDIATFQPMQNVSTLPEGFSGRNDAAEIAIHPSGKWLFASNRGHDSIAVFSIDPATGRLELTGDHSTGGKEPRHFAIDPTGQFLLAENQNSDSIVVFRINPETGALSQISITENVPSPVCLTFLRTP